MLDAKIEAALNRQINHEIAAAYNYLAMVAYFENENLPGFATWMRAQHVEEHAHANRLFTYVIDRGGTVSLDAIEKPEPSYDSPRAAFAAGLEMERANTREINELYALAQGVKDYATQSHLQWFLDEQVEEEKTFDEVLSKLDRAGADPGAMLILDEQLGNRAGRNASGG